MADPLRLELNDGAWIPQLGLGVWQASNDEAAAAAEAALRAGYRHVDTAAMYGNEPGVGEGVRRSGLPRRAVFVTTKIWNADQGYDRALRALDESRGRLGMDYVDLLLIHWPSPRRGLYVETWRALIAAREAGLARSIGVSNFDVDELDRIVGETGVSPALNQIEVHPRFQQRRLREANLERGLKTEAWSPLGQGRLLTDPAIGRLARKHARTPAQVIIRWHIESGLIVIPKSVRPARIAENHDVFGFQLDEEDMAAIAALDDPDGRVGPDPATATF
jgi:2,5-diketo-D-gluconate reductase A